MLMLGALIGRVTGILLGEACTSLSLSYCDEIWMSPGVFALIGAACFASGTSRLTVSLTMLILESCWDYSMMLPIVLGVIVAKWTAEFFCPPLYTSLIKLNNIPFLSDAPAVPFGARRLYCFVAADVMTYPCVSLPQRASLSTVLHVLRSTTHNNFPVVAPVCHVVNQDKPIFVFKGTVSRSVVVKLLTQSRRVLLNKDEPSPTVEPINLQELIDLEDAIMYVKKT